MGKMTEEELLSIIDRYGYDLIDEGGCFRAKRRHSRYVLSEISPLFIGDRYWQVKRIAVWIMEREKD
jgi:hypothetical protein